MKKFTLIFALVSTASSVSADSGVKNIAGYENYVGSYHSLLEAEPYSGVVSNTEFTGVSLPENDIGARVIAVSSNFLSAIGNSTSFKVGFVRPERMSGGGWRLWFSVVGNGFELPSFIEVQKEAAESFAYDPRRALEGVARYYLICAPDSHSLICARFK